MFFVILKLPQIIAAIPALLTVIPTILYEPFHV